VSDNIRRETFTVRSYDSDPNLFLAPIPLCRRIQEAAGAHADSFGVGVTTLQTRDLTWMLSRFRIRMESYPRFGSELTVQTWPSGIDKLFALRDFIVTDAGGARVASALSAWLIVNLKTRRPARVPTVFNVEYPDIPRAYLETAEKLQSLEESGRETDFHVRYRDVDANRHVNNVAFIEWVVESVPPEVLMGCRLRELDIDYVSEAHFPQTVKARCAEGENGVYRHGLYGEDGREIGRARTAWDPVA